MGRYKFGAIEAEVAAAAIALAGAIHEAACADTVRSAMADLYFACGRGNMAMLEVYLASPLPDGMIDIGADDGTERTD